MNAVSRTCRIDWFQKSRFDDALLLINSINLDLMNAVSRTCRIGWFQKSRFDDVVTR